MRTGFNPAVRVLALLVGIFCVSAIAVGETTTPAESRTAASEGRLAITNALVTELKNSSTVCFALKWSYLPESKVLRDQFRYYIGIDQNSTVLFGDEYTLKNEDLRDAFSLQKWFASLDRPRQELLARALSAGKYGDDRVLTIEKAIRMGDAAWGQGLYQALGMDEGGGGATVVWQDYVTPRRDFYAMRYLLKETQGAGVVLEFDPAPRGANPLAIMAGMTWKIRVFPMNPYAKSPLYRFAVEVRTGTIARTFRSGESAVDKAKLNITVGLMKKDKTQGVEFYRMIPASIAKDNTVVEADPVKGVSDLKPLESSLSPNSVWTTITTLTGKGAGGFVGPLFDNSSQARPFLGALIGSGVTTNIYGMNYMLSDKPDNNVGFMYAIVPTKDNALFLGPSLQFGASVAAFGARLSNTSDDKLATEWNGALSIDLGRLFGKGPKPTAITPELVNSGSQIWQDVDSIYQGEMLTLTKLRWLGCNDYLTDVRLPLVQTADAKGEDVTNGRKDDLWASGNEYGQIVLPIGTYRITAPAGYLIGWRSPTSPQGDVAADDGWVTDYRSEQYLSTKGKTKPQAIVYVLRRGYRIVVKPELPAGAELWVVRVKDPKVNLANPKVADQTLLLDADNYVLKSLDGYQISEDNKLWKSSITFEVADAYPLPKPLIARKPDKALYIRKTETK